MRPVSGCGSSVAQSQGSETGELWFLTSTVRMMGRAAGAPPLHLSVPVGLYGQSRHTQTGTQARTWKPLSLVKAASDNVELWVGLSQPVMGKV